MPTFRIVLYVHVEDEDIIEARDEDSLRGLKEGNEDTHLEFYVEDELQWAKSSFSGWRVESVEAVDEAKEKELWHWKK